MACLLPRSCTPSVPSTATARDPPPPHPPPTPPPPQRSRVLQSYKLSCSPGAWGAAKRGGGYGRGAFGSGVAIGDRAGGRGRGQVAGGALEGRGRSERHLYYKRARAGRSAITGKAGGAQADPPRSFVPNPKSQVQSRTHHPVSLCCHCQLVRWTWRSRSPPPHPPPPPPLPTRWSFVRFRCVVHLHRVASATAGDIGKANSIHTLPVPAR
jgi:hypothetical protein